MPVVPDRPQRPLTSVTIVYPPPAPLPPRVTEDTPDVPYMKTHIVPGFLAHEVVAYIATKYGVWPRETNPVEFVPLDPGGIVYAPELRFFPIADGRAEAGVYLCVVPDLLVLLDALRENPDAQRMYGDVRCFRVPCQWAMSVIPKADVAPIVDWLKGLLPEAIALLAYEQERSKDNLHFGPGRRRVLEDG